MHAKIILEDIKIYAYHGVLPEENTIGTNYLVNCTLHADLDKASQSDALEDTINYASVNEIIHQQMAIPSKLLEHVAGRIIKAVGDSFAEVCFIRLKITKLQPPMPGEMKGVSLEFEKNFA